jgi:MSHA biogenesis protein MshP
MFPRAQRGFGVIAAIVILVIMASLAGFIVTLSATQSAGSALDVQGTRAIFAAQSGIEWGAYQTLKGTPPCAASPGTDTPLGTIDGITVTVNCKTIAVDESGTTALYEITAFACSDTTCPNTTSPGPYYVERKVTALTGL